MDISWPKFFLSIEGVTIKRYYASKPQTVTAKLGRRSISLRLPLPKIFYIEVKQNIR